MSPTIKSLTTQELIVTDENQVSMETLKLSCLLRIADAIELMSMEYVKLHARAQQAEEAASTNYDRFQDELRKQRILKEQVSVLKLQVRDLRAANRKLKKQS